MSKNIKISPFALDAYETRGKRTEKIYKPDSVYGKTSFSNIAVLVFVFIDFFCLFTVWNLVQTENPVYIYCVALGSAIALDVPLAIFAIALKRRLYSMCSKRFTVTVCSVSLIVFVIAFLFSFTFRIVTKDLSFDIGTTTTITDTLATETVSVTDETSVIWFAALFNGVIPLLTSLSSFVISFFSYEPIDIMLRRKERELVGLQTNILEIDVAVAQAEDAKTHCLQLIKREDDLFAEAVVDKLKAEEQKLKQLARICIMEKLRDADDVSVLTESAAKINELYQGNIKPSQEFPDYVMENIS